MKKTHDLAASVGEYTNHHGEKKKRWVNCGAVFADDDGRISVKLESVPVGPEWSGWFSAFPADRERNRNAPAPARSDDDDRIPY